MDHPPIADDITEQTGIPLAVTRHLVQTAHSVESSREGMPPCSPPECPPTSPACYSDSSSSSDDEDEEDGFELHTAASYPRIKSPKALRELVKAIHDAVDEAALAHAEDAREAQDAESSAREKAEAQKRAAVALQEESERLMAELRKKNEQQKQKQTAHVIHTHPFTSLTPNSLRADIIICLCLACFAEKVRASKPCKYTEGKF